jgi:hypothetical protein
MKNCNFKTISTPINDIVSAQLKDIKSLMGISSTKLVRDFLYLTPQLSFTKKFVEKSKCNIVLDHYKKSPSIIKAICKNLSLDFVDGKIRNPRNNESCPLPENLLIDDLPLILRVQLIEEIYIIYRKLIDNGQNDL